MLNLSSNYSKEPVAELGKKLNFTRKPVPRVRCNLIQQSGGEMRAKTLSIDALQLAQALSAWAPMSLETQTQLAEAISSATPSKGCRISKLNWAALEPIMMGVGESAHGV